MKEELWLTRYSDEEGETRVVIPSKFEVCDRCEGKGTHVNPSVDGNGLSREDFDADPDFAEDYFSGAYDVSCEDCGGKRVQLVPKEEGATPEQLKLIEEYWENKRESAREARADAYTRRAENGWRE